MHYKTKDYTTVWRFDLKGEMESILSISVWITHRNHGIFSTLKEIKYIVNISLPLWFHFL